MKGPNGSKTLARQPTGFCSQLGAAPVSQGAGSGSAVPGSRRVHFRQRGRGQDIGPFRVTFTVVQPAVWTNADALMHRVSRAPRVWKSPGIRVADPEALVSVAGGFSRLANSQIRRYVFVLGEREGRGGSPDDAAPIVLLVLPPSGDREWCTSGVITVAWSSIGPLKLPEIDQGTWAPPSGHAEPGVQVIALPPHSHWRGHSPVFPGNGVRPQVDRHPMRTTTVRSR